MNRRLVHGPRLVTPIPLAGHRTVRADGQLKIRAGAIMWIAGPVAAALGSVLVGLVPEDVHLGVHLLGAVLGIGVGNCGFILAGLIGRTSPFGRLRPLTLPLSILAMAATVLLAVERDEAVGDAVAGGEGLVEQQPPDRREPGVRSGRAGLRPRGADHRNLELADDALLAGPGQEGNDVPPGGRPGAEPRVEIVPGAVTQVPSAAGQPGQERGRHGEALLGPLVGAVAERRRGGAAGSQVAQQAPAEEPFEQLAVPGIAGPGRAAAAPAGAR
jgi:hypothetical protein